MPIEQFYFLAKLYKVMPWNAFDEEIIISSIGTTFINRYKGVNVSIQPKIKSLIKAN
jgi:hypothetical protein